MWGIAHEDVAFKKFHKLFGSKAGTFRKSGKYLYFTDTGVLFIFAVFTSIGSGKVEIHFTRTFSCMVSFYVSGLYLHSSGIIGASPEGESDNAVLEIKCPYKYCNLETFTQISWKEKYIIYYEYIDKTYILDPRHDYYHQIQMQIYLAQKNVGYLFIWSRYSHVCFKIEKDVQWQQNIHSVLRFYANTFIPRIVSNSDVLNVSSTEESDEE